MLKILNRILNNIRGVTFKENKTYQNKRDIERKSCRKSYISKYICIEIQTNKKFLIEMVTKIY